MTVLAVSSCLCWSSRLGFLTCIDGTFQPPSVFLSPGSRKTGRNQPRPAETSRKEN
nr:MAG TPA: hypothetical protein [Caudoviricetes sp.]